MPATGPAFDHAAIAHLTGVDVLWSLGRALPAEHRQRITRSCPRPALRHGLRQAWPILSGQLGLSPQSETVAVRYGAPMPRLPGR